MAMVATICQIAPNTSLGTLYGMHLVLTALAQGTETRTTGGESSTERLTESPGHTAGKR